MQDTKPLSMYGLENSLSLKSLRMEFQIFVINYYFNRSTFPLHTFLPSVVGGQQEAGGTSEEGVIRASPEGGDTFV